MIKGLYLSLDEDGAQVTGKPSRLMSIPLV